MSAVIVAAGFAAAHSPAWAAGITAATAVALVILTAVVVARRNRS